MSVTQPGALPLALLRMPHRRLLLRLALGGAAALALVVAGTNAIILLGGTGTTADPARSPRAQAALVIDIAGDGRTSLG
jgi:hypothetical protein